MMKRLVKSDREGTIEEGRRQLLVRPEMKTRVKKKLLLKEVEGVCFEERRRRQFNGWDGEDFGRLNCC